MKRLLFCALPFLAMMVSGQETDPEADLVSPRRTWKSANGSTIDGILLFSDDTRVVIKPEGREPVRLQPEQLSPEDREYLKKWRSEQMTHWAHEFWENDDPRFSGSVVIIPKYDRPVKVDAKGELKEPFVVLYGVLEKNPNILRDAPQWTLSQIVEAYSKDGSTKEITMFGVPLAGTKGEVSLAPIKVGMSLTEGKTFLTIVISGTGKTVSNSLSVKVVVE